MHGPITCSDREKARARRPTTGRSGSGSSGPSALLKPETLKFVGWFLLVRAFTPLGAGLALFGLVVEAPGEATSPGTATGSGWSGESRRWSRMAFLAEKAASRVLLAAARSRRRGGDRPCLALARPEAPRAGGRRGCGRCSCSAWVQVRSTWRTPAEWNGLEQAAGAVTATVPADAWVVAPEALLFQADRRGCRMEWSDAAAARAAGEWGGRDDGSTARSNLVEYYRRQGARYFADLGCRDADPARKGLHDAVRRRYKVIVDRPDVIIADLADSETHWNAN